MEYCPYHRAFVAKKEDYPVDLQSHIQPEIQGKTHLEAVRPSPPNGGLYSGPQAVGPHASIPVYPTQTYFTHMLLRQGNQPPPGAIHQFSPNRPGNSHSGLPGVQWLNDGSKGMHGLYEIKGIKPT